MSNNSVLLDRNDDGIVFVTLNRPEVHNAFDEEMIRALGQTFQELAEDTRCRAVVLRGAGKSFSAGADLNWMKRAADFSHDENLADAESLAAMLNGLYSLPQMTIACVQGAALGGGLGLVSCCDMVIADVAAVFALSEVKIGLIPATISPYVLAAMGGRNARRYFQTGERFKGEKARELGLVHEVVTTEEEMSIQMNIILDHLCSNGPHAVREAKRLVMDFANKPLDGDMMAESAERIAAIRARPEAKEGLTAFLEKRKPDWQFEDDR